MECFRKKDSNTYIIYIDARGSGIWIDFYQDTGKINEIEFTNKLYSQDRIEKSSEYETPKKQTIETIWKEIILHKEWDKMIISQIFET